VQRCLQHLSSRQNEDCTVLHRTVLYCTAQFCTGLYWTVLNCSVLHCSLLYCNVLYCTVVYLPCTVDADVDCSSYLRRRRRCVEVATHRHGCCVLQRCVDFADEGQRARLVLDTG